MMSYTGGVGYSGGNTGIIDRRFDALAAGYDKQEQHHGKLVSDNDDYPQSGETVYTDIPITGRLNAAWVILFGIAMLILCGSLLNSPMIGSMGSLVAPRNFQGMACGWDSGVAHLPYLYLPMDVSGQFKQPTLMKNRATCVAGCPTEKDQNNHGYLSISEASAVRAKKDAAFVSILHSLRSPVYATTKSGSFCMPQHPDLAKQARFIYGSTQHQGGALKALAVSVVQALPMSFLFFGMSWGVSWLLLQFTLAQPDVSVYVSIVVTAVSLVLYGGKLIFSRSAALTGETYFLPGLVCIAVGVSVTIWSFNKTPLIKKMAPFFPLGQKAINGFIPSIEATHSLLQGCAAFIIYAMLVSFSFTQNRISTQMTPLRATLEPNGGIDILPLERQFERPQLQSVLHSLAIFGAGFWALEVLLALSKYTTVSATMSYYYSPKDERGDALEIGSSVHILRKAVTDQIGPLAKLAALRGVSRFCRIAVATAIGSRYTDDEEGLLEDIERKMAKSSRTFLHEFCDTIHNGVLGELVGSVMEIGDVMRASNLRMSQPQHAAYTQLIGLTSLVTWANIMMISTVVFIFSSSIALKYPTSGGLGVTVSMSPFITGLLFGVLAGYCASIMLSTMDAAVDGLLYSTMRDYDERRAGSRRPPTCPADLMELMYNHSKGATAPTDLGYDNEAMTTSEEQYSEPPAAVQGYYVPRFA